MAILAPVRSMSNTRGQIGDYNSRRYAPVFSDCQQNDMGEIPVLSGSSKPHIVYGNWRINKHDVLSQRMPATVPYLS
eukprot:scaffold20019_cov17-Prasinocladus_malaysianus.AAC.1